MFSKKHLNFTCTFILAFFVLIGCGRNIKPNTKHNIRLDDGLFVANYDDGDFYLNVNSDDDKIYAFSTLPYFPDSTDIVIEENNIKDAHTYGDIAELSIEEEQLMIHISLSNVSLPKAPLKRKFVSHNSILLPTTKRYLDIQPFSDIQIDSNLVYDNQLGFYASLPTNVTKPNDYKQYISEVAQKFESTTLSQGTVPLDLTLDIYKPKNDTVSMRPLIILVHGGAFLFGDKQSPLMIDMATHFSKRGYVVASINYRLGTSLLGIAALDRTIYRAVQDIRKATSFLSANNALRIDTSSVFLVGHSAGAVSAITSAFMSNGEEIKSYKSNMIREDLGTLNQSPPINALVGLWGAMPNIDIINRNDNVKALFFHGTEDDILPYNSGAPFSCITGKTINRIGKYVYNVYGSAEINNRMKMIDLESSLITFDGLKHDPHIDVNGNFNHLLDTIKNKTTLFLYQCICHSVSEIKEENINNSKSSYKIIGKSIDNIDWKISGGHIVNYPYQGKIDVCWFSNAPKKYIIADVLLKNGSVVQKRINHKKK